MALAISCSPWAEFAASGPVLGLPGRQKVDDNLTSGSQTSGVERREVEGVFWTIQKYGDLQSGPKGIKDGSKASNVYKMTYLKQASNCNRIFIIR
jgi:hypothetical protein